MKPDEAPVLKGWITASDAAERLGISRQVLNRKLRRGDFRTLRLLGSKPIYVLKEDEVDAMVERRQVAAG